MLNSFLYASDRTVGQSFLRVHPNLILTLFDCRDFGEKDMKITPTHSNRKRERDSISILGFRGAKWVLHNTYYYANTHYNSQQKNKPFTCPSYINLPLGATSSYQGTSTKLTHSRETKKRKGKRRKV